MPEERDGLASDLARETWRSWTAMPRWAQVTLVVGIVVHVAVSVTNLPVPHTLVAAIDVLAFIAIVIGLIENAKTLDEFYARVYLEACAISVVSTGIILFAAASFGATFGVRAVSILAGTFLLGFVVAFARLRRA